MPELLEAVLSHLLGVLEWFIEAARQRLPGVLDNVIANILALPFLALLSLLSKQVRQYCWLMVVWCSKQVRHGFWFLLRIPGHSLGLVGRAASGTVNGWRRLWGRVQTMRRERLKRRVIAKLRCYEARGELPAEQVEALVQAIALL